MCIKILISYFGIALFKFLSFRFMDFVGFVFTRAGEHLGEVFSSGSFMYHYV